MKMLLLSSSCLFIDIRIGFQKASYTFREPATFPETVILDLHKENEQLSERTLFVSVAVSDATSNPEIQSATISSKTMDNDYSLLGEVRRITQAFQPHTQTLQVYFDLFKDDIAEGTEAFQITALPDPDYLQAGFMSPINLFASTSIVILDANPVEIGFEGNYTVDEDAGSLLACLRVFNPPDEYDLVYSIDLLVDTVEGTAGELDYTSINSTNSDVHMHVTVDQQRRRACFVISITNDHVVEDPETFSLLLTLDPATAKNFSNTTAQIVISPSVAFVDIEEFTCKDLSLPLNGAISYDAGSPDARPANRTTALYTCDTGYNLIGHGSNTRLCQGDETWNGNAPTCEIVNCGPPPSISRGYPGNSTTTTFGAVVLYSCDEGFVISPESASSSCLINGEWSTPPTCSIVNCGPPPSISRGYPGNSTTTTFGAVVLYSCDEGFVISPESASSSCLINGEWSTPPTCSIVNCGTPVVILNGSPGTPTNTTFGGIVAYSCDDGFIFSSSQSANVTCLVTGYWMTPPQCVPDVNCGAPRNITNGFPGTPTNETYGGTVAYSCDESFAISSLSLVTCSATGMWKTIPTCTVVRCSLLPRLDSGNIQYSNELVGGSVATYECDRGYNLVGPMTRTCIKAELNSTTGIWSNLSSFCQVVQCEPLPVPENGKISYAPDSTPDYNTGTVATYQCNPGFNLEGNATRICVALINTTMWDGENETHTCKPFPVAADPQEVIVISASLGAVVLVLLIVIIIVAIVIVIIRKRSKHTKEPDMFVVGDHIYDDPNLIHFSQPALPNRNIHLGENQAYDQVIEMTKNVLYSKKATSTSDDVETEIGKCNSEGYINVDEEGRQIMENKKEDRESELQHGHRCDGDSYVSVKMQEDNQNKPSSKPNLTY